MRLESVVLLCLFALLCLVSFRFVSFFFWKNLRCATIGRGPMESNDPSSGMVAAMLFHLCTQVSWATPSCSCFELVQCQLADNVKSKIDCYPKIDKTDYSPGRFGIH